MSNVISFGMNIEKALPSLDNPATAADILTGKQAYNSDKEIINGIYTPINLNNYCYLYQFNGYYDNNTSIGCLPRTKMMLTLSASSVKSRRRVEINVYRSSGPGYDSIDLTISNGKLIWNGEINSTILSTSAELTLTNSYSNYAYELIGGKYGSGITIIGKYV